MRRLLVPALLLTLASAACAGGTPPAELRDARSAYNAAANGPAGRSDPASLHTARVALDRAEHWYGDEGDSRTTRDLAYIALRKAQIADASGRAVEAVREQQSAQVELQTIQQQRLAASQSALEGTKQSLAKTQDELESERRAHAEADRRAAEAMEGLKKVGAVKQEPRGMVLTISGAVLFATNQAKLLPASHSRLHEVAQALLRGNPSSKITVEGHTDSTGAREHNMDLSERRAQAVKDELVTDGISSDRIEVVGRGPDQPIASNKSPEGRANNRRVEIVVKPPEKGGADQEQPPRGGQTP